LVSSLSLSGLSSEKILAATGGEERKMASWLLEVVGTGVGGVLCPRVRLVRVGEDERERADVWMVVRHCRFSGGEPFVIWSWISSSSSESGTLLNSLSESSKNQGWRRRL
jgi:hypothetical protein